MTTRQATAKTPTAAARRRSRQARRRRARTPASRRPSPSAPAASSRPATWPPAASAPPAAATFTGDAPRHPEDRRRCQFSVKQVGTDGQMPNPNGPEDVAYYDFSQWDGLGGLPGKGGNVVMAGHVDYINYGPAVFWRLHELEPGDTVEIQLADGTTVTYKIEFNKQIEAAAADWTPIVAGDGGRIDHADHLRRRVRGRPLQQPPDHLGTARVEPLRGSPYVTPGPHESGDSLWAALRERPNIGKHRGEEGACRNPSTRCGATPVPLKRLAARGRAGCRDRAGGGRRHRRGVLGRRRGPEAGRLRATQAPADGHEGAGDGHPGPGTDADARDRPRRPMVASDAGDDVRVRWR